MNDRDELAATIRDGGWALDSEHFYADDAADAVIAAGWRKKPSREALVEAIENSDSWSVQHWSLTVAEAVLALMDGPTETGESK